MIKSHEDGSDDSNEFMHACTIIIFLLIKFLHSLIYSLNHLLQFIQFYLMFANFINFITVSSLTACCI